MAQKHIGLILKIGVIQDGEFPEDSHQKPEEKVEPQQKPKTCHCSREKEKTTLSIEDIIEADKRIRPEVNETPCFQSRLSSELGVKLYLKLELCQHVNSFKERGARNALLKLSESERKRGVITASAGNHAQGLSYHGKLLGIPVTVVMPVTAPLTKIRKCESFGANVILKGANFGESLQIAIDEGKCKNLVFVHAYDDFNVMAGQGTIGLEILKQVPDVDAVLVPVGGGGLISGVATAIKSKKPDTKIIAVESHSCPSMNMALQKGKPTTVTVERTLADGLAVPQVGDLTFATASTLIDKSVVVTEDVIALAITKLLETDKCLVEGAGATSVAAFYCGRVEELQGKTVVSILTGGNIDTSVLCRVLNRGLALDARLLQFSVIVPDKTCELRELCATLAEEQVGVRYIKHNRANVMSDVFSVMVTVSCETRDIEHAGKLKKILQSKYKNVQFSELPDSNMF